MSSGLLDNKLKKSLTLLDLVFFGLGNVTGAGVFVLITKTILYSGKYVLPVFILVTIISCIMGLVYLEIFNRYKSPICEYLVVKETLGHNYSHALIYIIYFFVVFSALTIVIALSKYIGTIPYFYFLNNYFSQVSMSISLILLMSFINYCGIETSKLVGNTIAIGLLLFLCGLILSSIKYFSLKKIIQGPVVPFDSIVLSAIIGFFLFNGFDAIVKISTEVIYEENVFYGLIITLLVSSIIYILIIISCLCVMGFKNTVHCESPLTKMYELLYNPQVGFFAYIVGIIIMFNTAFLSALTATRFMYSCANENHIMFSEFWKILNSNKVPSNAIIVTALIAILFSLFNNEVILAIFTNFSLFIILISLCASLLILRWNERTNIEKQKASNYIWGNVNNIPLLVVIQIIVLVYLFYKILINRFYFNYMY
jgi:APA family basic amino acid/polyamine antiporter|uniref:Amino acid permease/ SLC12A domain-containing protein n=1 Tax=viral metagenome TaxID=1070528 RepID=A0A6C0CEJ6_9ZZZZ